MRTSLTGVFSRAYQACVSAEQLEQQKRRETVNMAVHSSNHQYERLLCGNYGGRLTQRSAEHNG